MTSTIIGQAPTNLGPLTTTFTPPPACTVAVGAKRGLINRGDRDVAWLGQACSRGKPIDDPSCWPETSKGVEEKKAPLEGWGFYSPGLHCPVGYATACSAIGGSGGESGWPVQFKLLDGETAVGCCPSGFGCGNINGQTCIMVATSTTIPTVTCDGSKSGDFGFQTVPDEDAKITAFSMYAPMIQINWQSSDQPKSTSTKSSKTKSSNDDDEGDDDDDDVTATGTKTVDPDAARTGETLVLDGSPQTTGNDNIDFADPSQTPTLQENEAESDSDEGTAISSGAKVAIGVAGAAVGLVILVCAFFYVWRRRKSQREDQELDRLYGLKNTMSAGGDFTSSNDIPGWYRGQRLATPVKDRFGDAGGGAFGGVAEVERPAPAAAAYYRPYRP